MPDGTFRLNPDAENAEELQTWQHGLKIIPSIFNDISAIIEDEALPMAHILAAAGLVARMGYAFKLERIALYERW